MLTDPRLLIGDDFCAFRDPAAVYHNGVFHLYYTYTDDSAGGPWHLLGESTSTDLEHWTQPRFLFPKNKALNYSSPGDVVRDGEDWVICFQSYCRENGEKYGNARSRLWTMRSKDLEHWSEPEILRVKGDDVPIEDMGRMIDPFLFKNGDEWWCFFKQNGVSYSKSPDLVHWTFMGHTDAGENSCVVKYKNGYRLFTSPENGMRVMDSTDLLHWHRATDDLTLGQADWDWAREGRLSAGFVLDNTERPDLPRYIMFFHASLHTEEITFDNNASIAIAFSEDLNEWTWPGKK